MKPLDPDFREFIALLNSEKVEYLLLGGYAVNYYGHHRHTIDIDFWIAITRENAERVSRVLTRFGFSKSVAVADHFMEPNRVHMFGRPPVRIDLLSSPSGVEFAECFSRRTIAQIDHLEVPIISLSDLRRNKLASGRGIDMIDLEELPLP